MNIEHVTVGSLSDLDPFQMEGADWFDNRPKPGEFIKDGVEYAIDRHRVEKGFTQNAGNNSKVAHEMHDAAYWGWIPKRYL